MRGLRAYPKNGYNLKLWQLGVERFDEGANRHDMKLVRETIENIVVNRPEPTEEHPQNVCLDKGYDYQEVRDIAFLHFACALIALRAAGLFG